LAAWHRRGIGSRAIATSACIAASSISNGVVKSRRGKRSNAARHQQHSAWRAVSTYQCAQRNSKHIRMCLKRQRHGIINGM